MIRRSSIQEMSLLPGTHLQHQGPVLQRVDDKFAIDINCKLAIDLDQSQLLGCKL